MFVLAVQPTNRSRFPQRTFPKLNTSHRIARPTTTTTTNNMVALTVITWLQ